MTADALSLLDVVRDWIRAGCLRMSGAKVGPKVRVGPRCRVTVPRQVTLGKGVWMEADIWLKLTSPDAALTVGEHTFFARNCTVNVLERVSIGPHCLFGPNCMIIDHNHGTAPGKQMDEQPCASRPVSIGRDVWCGAGVVVLLGVSIGDGAVVGANSVVTKNVPAQAVVVGSPARVIRMRSEGAHG